MQLLVPSDFCHLEAEGEDSTQYTCTVGADIHVIQYKALWKKALNWPHKTFIKLGENHSVNFLLYQCH